MDECLRLAKGSEGWAMIVASQDLLREHLRELRGVAKRVDTLDHTDRVGYGLNWWQSGERKLVRLKRSVQIWVSKGDAIRPLPRDKENEIVGQWEPPVGNTDHLDI